MVTAEYPSSEFQALISLDRDLRRAAVELSPQEARYLVSTYYTMQEQRLRTSNQVRALSKNGEPHRTIEFLLSQNELLEQQVKKALEVWAESKELGQWCLSIVGIGPVITAGLMSEINIREGGAINPLTGKRGPIESVGHIWSFAGLNPNIKWEKGQKRPFNADLKVLCWKIGESFVKTKGNPEGWYGHAYDYRKAIEQENNENGLYAEQAAHILATKKIGKETEAYAAYSQGKLPAGHLHARAKRWAVKLFLSHYHNVAYQIEFGKEPPMIYAVNVLGHSDYVAPPNWPLK